MRGSWSMRFSGVKKRSERSKWLQAQPLIPGVQLERSRQRSFWTGPQPEPFECWCSGAPSPTLWICRPSEDTSSPASGTKVHLSLMSCCIPTSEMGSLQNRKVLFYSRGTNLKDPRTQTPKSSSLRLGFNGIYEIKNKMISGVKKQWSLG